MKDKKIEEILDMVRNLKKQLQELEDTVVDKIIKDIESKENPLDAPFDPYEPNNPILPNEPIFTRDFWTLTSTSELENKE